jgi:hypothetical protein
VADREPLAEQLLARYEELKHRRSTWDAHWQEVADYGLGRRSFTQEEPQGGRKRLSKVHDNTFMLACTMLAAGLHSLLSIGRWFRLKLENDRLNGHPDIREWIEAVEKQLYNAFNRPEAGFIPAMHEGYIDISAFGTGGVFIHDGEERGAIFIASPISGIYLGENDENRLDTYMWSRNLPARAVLNAYGRGALDAVDKAVDGGKPEERIRILRVVLPNSDYLAGKIGLQGFRWTSVHIGEADAKVLSREGYDERPFAIARWDKEAGETYGRGPGIAGLPNAKMLNEINRSTAISAQKRVEPPVAIPSDGVVSQLQMQPRGISIVKSAYMQANRPPIFELPGGGEPGIGHEMIELQRQSTRSAFHWELLQLLQQPYMTATHVDRLTEIQQRVTSPILGRLQSELLEPAVERVFGIELRNGRLPPVPEVLLGHRLRVEYISPVARAQKNFEANAARRVLAAAGEYSQFDQTVLHNVDADAAIRVIAEAEGTPSQIMRDPREVGELREALQRQAEEREQMEKALALAEGMSKAAPAVQAMQGGAGQAAA